MGGKGSGAPQQTDPKKLVNMTVDANKDIADYQSTLNNVNQITPTGSIKFKQKNNGQWVAKQKMSEPVKALFEQQMATQQSAGDLASGQLSQAASSMSQPLDFGGDFQAPDFDTNTVENRLMELGRSRLDPMLSDRRSALQTELVNRGIRPGSEAYDKAMNNANMAENDAYNQLVLTGRGQAMAEQNQAYNQNLTSRNQSISEALLKRQTPLQEYISLQSGQQLPSQNFVSPAQTGVAGADVAGIYQQNYANQANMYNNQQAQNQQTMGGLFGLGANALMSFSDRRLKTDIKRIGRAENGLSIYRYRFKSGGPMQIGFMADEVREANPDAVMRVNGVDMVDYGKAAA